MTDESGNPLPALVTINGQSVQADGEGNFKVEAPSAERNVINAELRGYALISYIHVGSPVVGLQLQLPKAQQFTLAPGEPVAVTDEQGTSIMLPPNALVDTDGKPAEKPIDFFLYTYNLASEPSPGDMLGIAPNG